MIPGRMSLLMIIFLNLLTIYMNIISKSPKSEGITKIMDWMIACIYFVFLAVIEYGIILFCRIMFDYKELPKSYAHKRLVEVDLACLLTSIISFTIFTIVYFSSTI